MTEITGSGGTSSFNTRECERPAKPMQPKETEMLRILTVCVTFALAITGIPGSGLFDQPAWSQATTPEKDGPSVSRVKHLFETRTVALKKSRNLDQFAKLEKEIRSTKKIMSEQLKLIKPDGTKETQERIWISIGRSQAGRRRGRSTNGLAHI
ncbi:MAG: hypothetical protein AAGE37_10845 [Pseudomonadota bacterium]